MGSRGGWAERSPHARSAPMYLIHAVALVGPFLVPVLLELRRMAVAIYVVRMACALRRLPPLLRPPQLQDRPGLPVRARLPRRHLRPAGGAWWAANHRHHHRHSDQPDDVHSPRQAGSCGATSAGSSPSASRATELDRDPDLARFPELRWLDRHHFVPPLGAPRDPLSCSAGSRQPSGAPSSRTVLLWHGTFTINSLAHAFGSRRYATRDDSRNNPLLAVLTLGEGWHNNHHHYPASASLGFFWWEIDVTYWVLAGTERHRAHLGPACRRPSAVRRRCRTADRLGGRHP